MKRYYIDSVPIQHNIVVVRVVLIPPNIMYGLQA